MNRISTLGAIGALAIAAGALAGCGGGTSTNATTQSSAATAAQAAPKSAPALTVATPVLASDTPAIGGKANASLLGLTTRHDGTKQVTYNGLPLYYYVADTKAGQATGDHLKDGFGLWVGMLASGKLAPDGSS